MKKLMIAAVAIVCLSSQASYAQGNSTRPSAQACSECERLILDRLTLIATNTESLKADGAAIRAALAELTQAVAALARRPARTPLLIENAILTDAMGAEEAVRVSRYCRDIGYNRGQILRLANGDENRQALGPGVTRGPIVCFDAAE